MGKKQYQSYLYQQRSEIKREVRPTTLTDIQKSHIKSFVKNKSKYIKLVIGVLLAITLIEISIPILTNYYIKQYSYFLEVNKLILSLVFFGTLLAIHLFLSYIQLKYEKSIIVWFLNDLREKWFSFYLNRSSTNLPHSKRSGLMAKITYHFSLLQSGIANSIFPLFYWIFITTGLILTGLLIDKFLLLVAILSIPVNLAIFIIAYVVAKYYVSKDQTLYSKILVFINETLEEFYLTKLHKKEKKSRSHLKKMVELDTYFRIKRELLMKFGDKIIFVAISFFVALIYLIDLYNPIVEIENSIQYIVYGAFFALIVKLFYTSLRIGLFAFPTKLGAVLSIPDAKIINKKNKQIKINKISYKADKVKWGLDKEKKNLKFNFNKGERILITGEESSGKSSLINVFAGMDFSLKSMPWIIKTNNKRYLYDSWKKQNIDLYIIPENFNSEATILELLTNENPENLDTKEINKMLKKLKKIEPLKFLFNHPKTLGQRIKRNKFSNTEKAILQMTYVLFENPSIVFIDNIWLDINNKRINKMLSILDKELKNTILVCFSTQKNKTIDYDKEYNI